MKILVYGTGSCASKVLENLKENIEVLAFIDSNRRLKGNKFNAKPVISIDEIKEYEFDYILIASTYVEEIFLNLLENNVDKDKILSYMMYDQISMIVKQKYDSLMKIIENNNYSNFVLQNLNSFNEIEMYKNYEGEDPNRIFALKHAAKNIYEYNIKGSVAEVGVFRGEFAAKINKFFPDRSLYLFDTFNSFNENELKNEISRSNVEQNVAQNLYTEFKNTSIDMVMDKMIYKQNIKIFKGIFPNTASNIDDNFAFVSLDCDFYESILEGLRFFYPKLNENGYIFVHDYNSRYLLGVEKAIKKYEEEQDIILKKISINDRCGTLIITK